MSHLLGKIINSHGRFFDILIADLERATGQNGWDVDLVGQILTRSNLKIRQLGLIPGDIKAAELRPALQEYFTTLERNFAQKINTEAELFQLLEQKLTGVKVLELSQLAKSRLRGLDPENFVLELAKLERGYFEFNQLRLTSQTLEIDQRLSAELSIFASNEVSRLELLLRTILKIDQRIQESNYLALILASSDRAGKLTKYLAGDIQDVWTLAGNIVPRQSIYRLLASSHMPLHQAAQADFVLLVENLTEFNPNQFACELLEDDFFEDSSYLGLVVDQIVSFNLFDQIEPSTKHFEEAVWTQLVAKYLTNSNLSAQIISQLAAKTK